MNSKVIVHISADFPDSMAATKTNSVVNLINATDGYRHIVYSLNRVSFVSGIVAVDFGPDRKAVAYGAPPRGLFHATYLDRVSNWILEDIQKGKFARDWVLENKAGQASFKATRALGDSHQIEEVGAKLRAMMPWIAKNKLVDTAKN